jgi:hypothetical protein
VEAQGGSNSSVRQRQLWCGKAGLGAARVPGSGGGDGCWEAESGAALARWKFRVAAPPWWKLRAAPGDGQWCQARRRRRWPKRRHGGDSDNRREGAAAMAMAEEKATAVSR